MVVKWLTHCLLGNFACFCRPLIFFFKFNFFENFFREYHQSVKHFGSRSDLGLNCFQRLTADDTSKKRVKISSVII